MAELPDGTKIFKMFSNEDVTSFLDDIFVDPSTDPKDLVVQHWNYTFPYLTPKNTTNMFQPIFLSEKSKTLIYLNALESTASAMETSIIAGRNAALILSQL